ncbi:MAG TPA: DUF998 domain-containing protein [Bacteroidota bacterium]|nr:DUF998 domain-containing protein [Bacteroidota bacterium]
MLKSMFIVVPDRNQRLKAISILALLLISVGSLLAAPSFMPESYSWISHTTSESAAQGLKDAWLARLGFVTFGLAVMWIASSSRSWWAQGAVWFHNSFGVFMVATAAFSHSPWLPGVPSDSIEDFLHSFTATAMGFGFIFGVLIRLLQRRKNNERGVVLDSISIAVATAVPMLMALVPTMAGLFQRLMFLTAYVWYGKETCYPSMKVDK